MASVHQKKNSCRGFQPKKKFMHKQVAKKTIPANWKSPPPHHFSNGPSLILSSFSSNAQTDKNYKTSLEERVFCLQLTRLRVLALDCSLQSHYVPRITNMACNLRLLKWTRVYKITSQKHRSIFDKYKKDKFANMDSCNLLEPLFPLPSSSPVPENVILRVSLIFFIVKYFWVAIDQSLQLWS